MGQITFFDKNYLPVCHIDDCHVTVVQPQKWQDILESKHDHRDDQKPKND